MNKTKRAIFNAAITVFSSNGYDSATVDEVVAAAGVAKGTLYYHFKSKEELFIFIVKEGINLIYESVEGATKDIIDPVQRLKTTAQVALRYCYENKELLRVILSQIWGDKNIHQAMREEIKLLLDLVYKFLEDLNKAGYIKNDDTEILSYGFIGVLFSSALYEILNDDYNHEEVIEKFMSYITYRIK